MSVGPVKVPVIWLSVKHTGVPVPQAVYGYTLEKVSAKEEVLLKDPKELEVRKIYKDKADAANAVVVDLKAASGLSGLKVGDVDVVEGGR